MIPGILALLLGWSDPPPSHRAPSPAPVPAGTCLLGACVDAPDAVSLIRSRVGTGARARGGYAQCFYLPDQELFFTAGLAPDLPEPHRLQFLYLGRYPWPDCATSRRTRVPPALLVTGEGLAVGDAEARVKELYAHATGLKIDEAGSERRYIFYPVGRHLVTEIGVVRGQVVTIQVSHAE